jgi:hypothetical protein
MARVIRDQTVIAVLGRRPAAPPRGQRVGKFIRDFDAALGT